MRSLSGNEKLLRRLPALILALVFAFAVTAFAAPGRVRLKAAKSGSEQVTLTWTRVSKAAGYYIYQVSGDRMKRIARVKGASRNNCVVRNLENGRTYRFAVAAYSGKQVGPHSNVKTAALQAGDPGKIKAARVEINQYRSCTLRWSAASNATHYQILYQNAAGEYVPLKVVRRGTTRLRLSNLKGGEEYRFRIRALAKGGGKTVFGPMSENLSAYPLDRKTLRNLNAQVHPFYYKARTRRTLKADGMRIPSGKTVTVTKRGQARSVITYQKKSCQVPTSALTFRSYIYNPRKAPKAPEAQTFVNIRGYRSDTKNLIWINTYSQHLYLFEGTQYGWRLIKDTKCSTGMFDYPTPIAVSRMSFKRRYWQFTSKKWLARGGDMQVGYWAMSMRGGAIHSWLYNYSRERRATGREPVGRSGFLWNRERYGHPASHGCVRVPIKFCKWMYDRVPLGTTVVVY